LRFAHCHRPPLPPSRVSSQYIPPEIAALVLRALAKRPHDRFVSADAMAAEIATLRAASLPPAVSAHTRFITEATTSPSMSATMPSLWLTESTWSSFRMALRKPFFSPMLLASIALLALLIAALALGVAAGRTYPRVDVAVRYVV
jgi:hypothetical protein